MSLVLTLVKSVNTQLKSSLQKTIPSWGRLILVGMLSFLIGNIYSQSFSDITVATWEGDLVAAIEVSSVWADVNNDGSLDLIYSGLDTLGLPISGVYLNSGAPNYTLSRYNLGGIPGLKEAALAAGDVDNDGDIDVLISGETFGGSFITDVYKNDGEGAFASAFTLEGISRGAISLGDLDNDGDLDAVTAGESASGVLAEVYLNNGNGNMNSSQTLLGLVDGDIDLGDFDADGDLDMAICGADNLTDGDANLIIYTQDGTGNFSSFEELTGFVHADLEWSDLNTDGILELVVAGATSPDKSTAQASVFVFDGDDGFSASTLSGIAIVDAKLAIGDYTNDGLSDVLITGEGVEGLAEPAASLVLLKNGSTSVMDVDFGMTLLPTVDEFSWTSELVGIQRDVRWMDINNDSKLDFISLATIITAEADTFESFVIYENILDLEPLALVAPTDLTLSQEETTLIISWTDNANTGEITYQLGLGSEPGTYDIISPNFVSSTSTRSLAERGKWVGPNTFKFNGLANGTYYAVVQAIGANFQVASTPEASGALEDPLFKDATAEVFDTDDNPFGLFDGEIAFADINSDGNQDLIVAGNSSADPEIQIYENDGDASFSAPTILASITQPQLEFADLDLDGNLDIMVFGFDGGDYKWLAYKGEGNGSFSLLSSGIVDNVTSAVGKLGDFNGDGNLDMIIAGEAGGSPFTTIYQNINGTFSALAVQPLAPISQAALALADFNKDGRTDIFLSGNGTTGNEAYLYEGQGNFQFSTVTTEVNALQQGNAVWGDYDSDGDLDLLLSGKTGDAIGTASTVIYSPNGTGVYNPSGLTLPAIDRGEVKWADFNEDGLLDILFVGQEKDTELPLTALFRYDLESGSYLPVPDNSLSFPGIQDGQLAWGFANDDQKLDFAIQGKDASDAIIFKLYLNGEESENFSPGVPQDLTTDIGQQNITLSWNPPAGSTARVEGFSYHVFVGNAADTEDISSPPSLIDNGTHLISEFGAQSAKLVLPRDSFPEGTYYWGVQAIDQDFEGSTFATTTFTIQGPDFSDVTTLADLDGFSNTKAALAWGDYQNDGDLDLFMLGEKDGNAAVAFFVNQGDETFDIASLGIAALTDGDAVFWDYNGDRFLDLIISGDNAGQAETRLYKGNEDGSFTEVNAGITGVRNSSLYVGDFDRDGDMDLLLAGITQADVRISTIFENQGSDTFAELAGLDLPGVNAAVKWIDVNNDGWMDIILSGEGTDGPIATIYLNQTNKTFSQDTQSSLTAVSNSSLDLADIDNDGDTDLILTGDADGTATAIIYENNDGVLAEKQSLTGIKNGEARFGDLDNDGFVDIIISGESQDGSSITQLYLNSAGIFSLSTINSDFFEGLTNSALAVGDFDQDESKDLDFILTGTNSEGESIKLYKNNYDVEFTTPAAPTSLVANQQGTKAILSWEAATGSQASGYQYNILMESAASGGELIPALSDKTTGFRKVVSIGNVGQVLQTEVNGLVPGEKYTWQVQSIDQAFRGSSFSTADEFAIEQLPFEEEFDVVFNLVLDGFTESTLKLVDVDSDGDLEVVGIGADKNGTPTSFILQNAINENAGMTFQALPLGLKDGDIAAADVDNDGDIDLFLCGDDGAAARSVLYLNNGSGGFTASTFSFNGILGGDAEWADLDNDGDVDLVVSGNNGSIARTFTYVNQLDQGTFLLQITTLPGLERGAIHLADVNNDGITDVLMSGSDGTQLSGVVAINDGELAFTLDEDELPGFLDAALAAGDVDNDGDIDVFVSGNANLSGSTLLTELYINDGTGDFQKDDLDLTDVSNGTLVLLDIDLDGKRDLILQGAGTANVLELWNNETLGNDISFEKDDVNSALFPALGGGSGIVVGELDGNSTPDLLFTGLDDMGTTPAWYFFSNGGAEGNNTMAPAPGGLAASQSGSTALLSWNTRENGETYNFYVGSTTGTLDKNSPDAIISSGRRLLLADGNAGHNNATTLKDLAPGTYFWAVQAVDHDGEGSPFSAEATFEIAPPFFADVTETAFTAVPEGVENGALTWGDYESDGDLDLLVTGTRDGNPSTQLFVNNGDGTFQEINSGLVNIQAGDALFFDGNNDGILDILLTGETNADPVSIYYVGSMNGSFTETQNLTGVRNSSASVRDFDRDGDLDLILAGIDKDDNRITSLYRNDGASFSEVSGTAFAGVNANISWWDYNNDGNPDILITGEGSDGPLTALYENQGGSGSFSEVADLGIPGLSNSSVSIGDYDNDGDEDLLVSGSAGLEFITRLYRNDNGSVNAAIGFEGVRNGSTAFGDYNHDGFLDILLTGEDEGGEPFALLYLNNTDDTFTLDLINSPVFTGLRASQAAFGDFDRDGNNTLDIIMMGSRSAGSFLTLYKNSTTQPNLQPTAPTGLSSQQQGNIITLSWERPTGGSAGGYSFNVLLRAVATGEVIFSAQADNNGLRRILGLGNAGYRTSLQVIGLEIGEYQWSVQSVDQDMEGSGFAPTETFKFVPAGAVFDPSGIAFDGVDVCDIKWADLDADKDIDAIVIGENSLNAKVAKVYLNDGTASGSFTESNFDGDPGIANGTISLGDYDLDGDTDALVIGDDGSFSTILYTNDGTGKLSNSGESFEGLLNGEGTLGDVDNDGDQDILIAGTSTDGPFLQLYLNTAGSYAATTSSLPEAENARVAMGDLDNDGDMDVVLTGVLVDGGRTIFAEVYENQDGIFTDINAGLTGLVDGNLILGDINNDGNLDILITGSNAESGGTPTAILYNNDGTASFSQNGSSLTGVVNGQAKLGDINNDGWLDALISGQENSGIFVNRVYLNNAAGLLAEDPTNTTILQGVANGSSLALADYNGDGKLDLLQGGLSNGPSATKTLTLYNNIDGNGNISPTAPSSLSATQAGTSITLSWAQLSTVAEQAGGYSYNLYIQDDPDGNNLLPPLADVGDGSRRIIQIGDVQAATYDIKNLAAGNYNWGVQAIDQNFEGSAFTTGSFTVQEAEFQDVSTLFGANRTTGMFDPAAVWFDHNLDGRLDLLLVGETAGSDNTELFINSVSGFQEIITDLDDVSNATVSVTDFNSDNRADLFISGSQGATKVSQLYQGGPGEFGFTKVTTGIQPISGGSSDWDDFNLDGRPDLLISGLDDSDNPVTALYQNLGSGVFEEVVAGLTAISGGEARWIDYNNDQLPDVILSGTSDGGAVTELFSGNGDGSFTKIGVAFTTFTSAAIDIADIDNDGFLDIIIVGNGEGGAELAIYRNNGGTTFAEDVQGLTEVVSAALDMADIDEDGDVDMLVTGQVLAGGPLTSLYLNDGTGEFTLDALNSGVFPDLHRGVVKWADFDNNGKLDLFLAGNQVVGSANFNSFLFENLKTTTDQVPTVPTALSAIQAGNAINLSWEAPANVGDDEEPGIQYNVYVSRNPGFAPSGLLSPLATIGTGVGQTVDQANIGNKLTRSLTNLTPGTYYWSVQAVDQGYDRSAFATEQSFTFIPAGASFLDETPSLISGITGGWRQADVSTADIDNDDDLDFIITGINSAGDPEIRVYLFTGGAFTLDNDLTNSLVAVSNPSIEWQDVNRDGFLDVLIAGVSATGPISVLYENEGGNQFSQLTTFQGVNASVAWGDYDNDGLADVLVTGQSTTGPVSILYHNDGGGTFSEATTVSLVGVQESSVLWSDINIDGYLDIVLTGSNGTAPVTLIYLNDQAGNFTNIGNGGMDAIRLGDIEAADYNNDGFPDFVMAGESAASGFNPLSAVYRNNGDQTFTLAFSPVASREGSVAWGDYNNDGFTDFVIIGKESNTNNSYFSRFYTNNGGTGFTEDGANSSVLPDVGDGATLSWGDLDGDEKLDLLLSGRTSDVPPLNIFSILTNIDGNANTTLTAPAGLSATQVGTSMFLNWSPPTGVATNLVDGITYNLRVGSTSGSIDILTPLTDATDGFNRVPQSGAIGGSLSWPLNGLGEGQYFWSVQAVDQDFETSDFSAESQFQVVGTDFADASATAIPGIPDGVGLENGNISWVDYNSDGELDFIITGQTISGPQITVFENDNGVLSQTSAAATDLTPVTSAALDAADYDNDGDLDVLITGTNSSGNGLTNLYAYDQGDGKFEIDAATSTLLENVTKGDIKWGDYDNDGDLDILLVGDAGTPTMRIYENDGLGNYTEDNQSGVLIGIEDGKVAWIDLDGDRDLDIVANGSNGTIAETYLYENNGAGTYTNISDNDITGTVLGDLAYADIDNDGDLDLAISGLDFSQTTPSTTLYLNDGTGDFSDAGASLMGSSNGSLAFGDYNEDQFPDLLIAGFDATQDSTKLYDNLNGTFTESTINSGILPAIGFGRATWADYDRDGKLDIALTGRNGAAAFTFKVFENTNANANATPDEPENLTVSIINNDITLNWQAPTGYPNPDGLSYALYLESVSEGEFIKLPKAFITGGNSGLRKSVSLGNVGPVTSHTISGLPAGDYAWSVQAIDQDFEGSIFSPEQTFTYQPAGLIFFDQSVSYLPSDIEGVDQGDLAFADVNNDGFLDFVVTGVEDDGDVIAEYYFYNSGDDDFEKETTISSQLRNVKNGSLDWGDINNDGLPDLILTGDGSTTATPNPQTRLYENTGTGFTEVAIDGEEVINGDAIFGDFNNDGLQDIFITGSDGTNGVSELLQNIGGSSFEEIPTGIASLSESSADWGDFNNDGLLDLALMGEGNGGPVSFIYRNDGSGIFTGINVDLADVKQGEVKWVDIDNDQDLDIILCGEQTPSGSSPITELYLNEGNEVFSLSPSSFTGVREGKLVLGDINQDTYPDLILTGRTGILPTSRVTEVYLNDGSGGLVLDNINSQNIQAVDNGSYVGLADVIKDRRLDLVMLGRTSSLPESKTFKVYENITTTALTTPTTPTNLVASQEGNEIVFSWQGSGDNDLSYNLYIGSALNLQDAKSSLSTLNGAEEGYRRIVKLGNVGFNTSWRVNSLPSGTYQWGIQSIDQDLEGSLFIEGPPVVYVAPDFLEVPDAIIEGGNLPAFADVAMAWGDFDNDEDLDLVIAGSDGSNVQTRLYRNDLSSDNEFDLLGSGLPGVRNGDIEWADIDADGDLDLIITGESGNGTPITRVLTNGGGAAGDFTTIPTPAIPQLINSELAIGDLNNDGSPDIVLTGLSQNGKISEVFLNQAGSFTALSIGLTPMDEASVAIFDIDKDGKQDILLSGSSDGAGLITEVYLQTQDLNFRRKPLSLPGLQNGSIDWADFDLDGFHDLLLTGDNGPNRVGAVYNYNQADTSFVLFAKIDSVESGNASWGDFNEDGFTDIILTGQSGNFGTDRTTILYRNNNGVGFVEEPINSQLFQNLSGGSAAKWADFNTDGRLDLAIVGVSGGNPANTFKLYTNELAGLEADVVPTPINLAAVQDGFDIEITWDPSTTVSEETTYELIVGTTRGGNDIRAGLSDPGTGFRRVPTLGELAATFSYRLTDISTPGKIYYALQAIENDFETSPFIEDSITYVRPDFSEETSTYFSSVPALRVEDGAIAWGDAFGQDASDFLDLFITGATDSVPKAFLYLNNGGNTSLSLATDTLPGVRNASAAWGDYDNDGNLDLLYAGEDRDGNPLTKLYRRSGNSLIDISAAAGLDNISDGDVYWVDYDNDGDQDIFLTGRADTGPVTKLFENIEGAAFIDIAVPLPDLQASKADWADFNGDGLMDLVIMGQQANGLPFAEIYRNESNGAFGAWNSGIIGLMDGDIKWGDFNNDGEVDLALIGIDDLGNQVSAVYRQDIGGVFTQISIPGLPALSGGSIEFADFDNDGYRDLLMSGNTGTGLLDHQTVLLKNNRSGGFFLDNINSSALTDAGNSTVGVADVNLDGKIDVLLAGMADDGVNTFLTTRLFTNITTEDATVPSPPQAASLLAFVDSNDPDRVTLRWNPPTPPSGLDASVVDGYTYNIYLRRGGTLEASPLSDILSPANRRVVRLGNTSHRTEWVIDGLPSGEYSWSVQSVDQDFQSSVFAPEPSSFTIDAPIFADVTSFAIPAIPNAGISESSLDWGDFDNDGDLDLLISGESSDGPVSRILRNRGNGIFDDYTDSLGVALIQVRKSLVSWGDFNADGNLDFFISGEGELSGTTFSTSEIYKGDGLGGFTTLPNLNIVPIISGDAEWGDYDNDGDLDLATMGIGETAGVTTAIYRNNGDETFTRIAAPVNIGTGELAWGDYDGDLDLDLFISGARGLIPSTRLFENNNGLFQELIVTQDELQSGSIDLGDYDNDGDLDLLLTGKETNRSIAKVYRNEGSLPFVDIGAPLDSVAEGRAIFGDYNDDGLLDIFLVGSDRNGDRIAKIYNNDTLATGGFLFDQAASTTLRGADEDAYAAWGDFDGDDKIDLVVSGLERENAQGVKFRGLRFYKNNEATPNGFPGPPVSLSQTADGNVIEFVWSPPEKYVIPGVTDSTGIEGRTFSYNLLLGSLATGEIDVITPMADTTDGYRKVVRQGNVGYDFSWRVENLQAGDYFWSVQAIDADFEGSAFPAPVQFTFIPTSFQDVTDTEFPVNQLPMRVENAAVNFGDFDNDEDLDILISGKLDDDNFATRLYEYDSGYLLNPAVSDSLIDLRLAAAEWGDYDNDGDLDVFLAGQHQQEDGSLIRVSIMYENANGTFVAKPSVSQNITPVFFATAKFGDYDNDGDLDLFVAGRSESSIISEIYKNVLNPDTDERVFVRDVTASSTIVGIEDGSAAWGDFDQDNFLDLVITGESATGPLSVVYKNSGDGTFVDGQYSLIPMKNSSVSWGDFNNDGFLDLLMAGESTTNAFRPESRIYRYDNDDNEFQDIVQAMEDVRNSSVSWADFDNDGYLDFFLLGEQRRQGQGDTIRISSIYRGRQNSNFIQDLGSSNTIGDFNFPNGVWGDYDADGRIDLLLTGINEDLQDFGFALYRNTVGSAPRIPDQITGLQDTVIGDEIRLSWDVPANYNNADFSESPSYNIALGRIGTSMINSISPMADTLSGRRSIVEIGNAGHTRSWTLKELPDGRYCWAVQALAENYQGGAFSDTACFNFINPRPVIELSVMPELVRYEGDTISSVTLRDTSVVERIELNYKGISETQWNKEVATFSSGTTYEVVINAGLNAGNDPDWNLSTDNEIGIEYYLVAIGKFPVIGTKFTDTTDVARAYLRFDGTGLQEGLRAVGREVSSYNILAIPLTLDDPSVKATLGDDFGDYNIFEWRFWYQDALGVRQEYDSVASLPLIEPGVGYWLIRDGEFGNQYNTGSGNTVRAYADSPFVWTLTSGYNQIGNPYNFNLKWSDIIDYNKANGSSVSPDSLDKLDLNTFEEFYRLDDDVLLRNQGAFVYTNIPIELKIPVTKNIGVQSLRTSTGDDFPERLEPIDATNWMVDIRLRKGDIPSWMGAIGMNKTAIQSYDKHDVIAPPKSFGYSELVSYHPEYASPRFGVDVVPTQESYVWEMVLEQLDAEDPVYFEWNPSYFGNGDKELILYDVEKQKPVNMRMVNQYVSWSSSKNRPFKIYYGPQAFIDSVLRPDALLLGEAYPNPAQEELTIPFTLPPSAADYAVSLEMYNTLGQKLFTLFEGRMTEGFHEQQVNLSNPGGEQLSNGVYLYKLRVKGREQSYEEVKRFVIKK